MDEQTRKSDFMAQTGQSEDTFNWYKQIFPTWLKDQTDNYNNFFQLGLKPMADIDLQMAQAAFSKALNDVNAELASRGL